MAKVALLIGVSEYEPGLNPLPAAVKDLDAMREVLLDPEIGGFAEHDVTLLKNPDRQLVEESIYTLFSGRQRDDLLLLFFSGHGIKDDSGTLYLATRSTRKSLRGELITPTAVSASFIHSSMSRSRSKRQVVILDSCFSGAFAEGLSAKDDGIVDISKQLGGEGRAVLTSSSSTQYSFEQDGEELSLYTRFLIEGIKTGEADLDEDDVISIDELHEYARRKVQEVKPEIKPELYAIREGFKIRLLNVPQGDPHQKYKKEVARCGQRGKLTLINRSILDAWRVRLGLSLNEARILEAEVLEPYHKEFQQKLRKYESVVTEVFKRDEVVSSDTRQELQNLQRVLELRNEDTVPIEAKASSFLKKRKQDMQAYYEFFSTALRQKYPISSANRSNLQKKQQEFSLSETDVASIEAQVTSEVETYLRNLNQYERAFLSATQKEYPLSKSKRDELRKYQNRLKLTDVEIAPVEAKVATQIETYQQKIQQYEDAFSGATQLKYKPNEATKRQLEQTWQNLGLSEADVKSIELQILEQVEAYQANLRRYEREFSNSVEHRYPLSQQDLQSLKQRKQALHLTDQDAALIENLIVSLTEEKLRKTQQYEQVFSDSIKYEFPVSDSSREEFKRLQNVLELEDNEVEQIESKVVSQSKTIKRGSQSSSEDLAERIRELARRKEENQMDPSDSLPSSSYHKVISSSEVKGDTSGVHDLSSEHHRIQANAGQTTRVYDEIGKKTSGSHAQTSHKRKAFTKLLSNRTALVIAVAVGFLAVIIATPFGRSSQSIPQKALIDEVWQLIDKEYFDSSYNDLDWDSIRTTYLNQKYTAEEEVYTAIREMLEKLEDPSTRFLDSEEYKSQQVDNSGELTGVGMQLRKNDETEEITVSNPIDKTPAYEAGVLSGDVITAVDDQSTEGMALNAVVSLIRGQADSKVKISVSRDGEPLTFNLTRTQIEIKAVQYSVETTPEGTIGYIRLMNFSENSVDEMSNAIKSLEGEGVSGYVLDLRGNGGGLMFPSINIAKMWIQEGIITSSIDRDGVETERVADKEALTDKPLVVLIDEDSASASEILSSALQENDRAAFIGTKTFGKSSIQSLRDLSYDTGILITTSQYLSPSGKDIDGVGIEPDFVLELTTEQKELLSKDRDKVATLEDPQYSKALEVLADAIRTSR